MHGPLQRGTEILTLTTNDQGARLHVVQKLPCTLYSERKQIPPAYCKK